MGRQKASPPARCRIRKCPPGAYFRGSDRKRGSGKMGGARFEFLSKWGPCLPDLQERSREPKAPAPNSPKRSVRPSPMKDTLYASSSPLASVKSPGKAPCAKGNEALWCHPGFFRLRKATRKLPLKVAQPRTRTGAGRPLCMKKRPAPRNPQKLPSWITCTDNTRGLHVSLGGLGASTIPAEKGARPRSPGLPRRPPRPGLSCFPFFWGGNVRSLAFLCLFVLLIFYFFCVLLVFFLECWSF